jgi:hypothetical protein
MMVRLISEPNEPTATMVTPTPPVLAWDPTMGTPTQESQALRWRSDIQLPCQISIAHDRWKMQVF